MKARQNPLFRIESFLQNIVEKPFKVFFPPPLEPPEVLAQLEHATEDHLVLAGDGRLLAPIIYDIHLSNDDFQRLQPTFALLRNDWQQHLIQFAQQRERNYVLKARPILTLIQDSALRLREIKIVTDLGGVVPEILAQLERAMENNLDRSVKVRQTAPTTYDISLSINDYQQLSPSFDLLKNDWANHLVEFAREHDYALRAMPILLLHTKSKLMPGMVEVEARMAIPGGQGILETQALSREQLEQLQRQQLSSNPSASGIGTLHPSSPGFPSVTNPNGSLIGKTIPPARLTIRLPHANQQVYQIQKPVINIGRQLDNDIIVEDKRVSRHHAQIKFQPDGEFVIFDLGSTNGITINNIPSQRQHTLRSGDHFNIGNYDFHFERR
jgi:hypothetical protein